MNSSTFFTPRILSCFLVLCALPLAGCGGRFSGPSDPTGIKVTADSQLLDTGASTTVKAVVTDFSGRELPKADVTWESSDSDVATVTPTDAIGHTATVQATQAEGQTQVFAHAGDQSAQVIISVSLPVE